MTAAPRAITNFSLRPAMPDDHDRLVDIWWRSASATHRFLSVRELEALLPEVHALRLETLDTCVLCDGDSEAIGFLVMAGRSVESLFILPEWQRRGGGSFLMRYARERADRLTVEVNERNADALGFYRAQGFEIRRRSDADRAGRPYALLYLEESPAGARASRVSGVRE